MSTDKPPKRPRRYRGKTEAYRRFVQHSRRSELLLEAGLTGLGHKVEPVRELIAKLLRVKPKTRASKSDPYYFEATRKGRNSIAIEMGLGSRRMLLKAMKGSVAEHTRARFHFYGILVVDAWSSFETYVMLLMQELFERQPNLLAGSDQLTVKEVLDQRDSLLQFLSARQVDRLGNMKLRELLDYLESRLNLRFGKAAHDLAEVYLIRNIIAHSSGIVRSSDIAKLPPHLKVVNRRKLQVTREYVVRAQRVISRAVTSAERHIARKFYSAA